MSYITLTKDTINSEHICCGFSDKKSAHGYECKKEWLKREFDNGYVFRRLDERAKVFTEYGPAESAWVPINAPNYLLINCLWVSGQYKGKGHAKALLQSIIEQAKSNNNEGLVTVVGTKKFHFMSDTKWFLKQGFETIEKLSYGFSLLSMKLTPEALVTSSVPAFKQCVQSGECEHKDGLVVYYSHRCPFTEYHVHESLKETARKRNISLKIIPLESMEQAQNAPSPATIFSLFYNGHFLTTDISACMDSRFDKSIASLK